MNYFCVDYTIGRTTLSRACFDIDEVYDAVRDIRAHDPAVATHFAMSDIMKVLVDMKSGSCLSFEAESLRILCRGGDADAKRA